MKPSIPLTSLAGKKVIITRPPSAAEQAVAWLKHHDAEPLVVPLTVASPLTEFEADALTTGLSRLKAGDYEAVAFTSRRAVEAVGESISPQGGSVDTPHPIKVPFFAVGQKTKQALSRYGLACQSSPPGTGAALAKQIDGALNPGSRVLFLKGRKSRPELVKGLSDLGHEVHAVTCYALGPNEDLPDLPSAADWIIVMSPEAARLSHKNNLLNISDYIASIGPTTSAEIKSLGYNVTIEADTPDLMSLLGQLR